MNVIKLNKKTLIHQVTMYGYIPQEIPPCFSAKSLAEQVDDIIRIVKLNRSKKGNLTSEVTKAVTLSTYKNELTRRDVSFPNPEQFLQLVKLYGENWDKFEKLAESENSLSKITYIRQYTDDIYVEALNSEKIKNAFKDPSDFFEGVRQCIRIALGFQYRLKVDISNCYNSIYTHSITWAICGKDKAKEQYKNPPTRTNNYKLGDDADTLIRAQKDNETNGILVGPYTSRIFSEIILAGIDRILREKKFVFRRFVDDYKFYFRSEAEALQGVNDIGRILNEYNLILNQDKTVIEKFPYENMGTLKKDLYEAYYKDDVLGVLDIAAIHHSNGVKGAYKYALKMIRYKNVSEDDMYIIFPLLVNIMLLDPRHGEYIIDFFEVNQEKLELEGLVAAVNTEINKAIESGLQQEVLLFIYIAYRFKLKVGANIIQSIIKNGDDFSRIIALDIYQNHRGLIDEGNIKLDDIRNACQELACSLENETYKGEHWLLLFEIDQCELMQGFVYSGPQKTAFFEELSKRNIHFYESESAE